jgi:hypothetical protein
MLITVIHHLDVNQILSLKCSHVLGDVLFFQEIKKLMKHCRADDVIAHALAADGDRRKLDQLNWMSRRVDRRQDWIGLPSKNMIFVTVGNA